MKKTNNKQFIFRWTWEEAWMKSPTSHQCQKLTQNWTTRYQCMQWPVACTTWSMQVSLWHTLWKKNVMCCPPKVNMPHHNPSKTGWYPIYLPQRDVKLKWFTCPQKDTHRGSNHLIATQPRVKSYDLLNVRLTP